jgi:hypothetical protein
MLRHGIQERFWKLYSSLPFFKGVKIFYKDFSGCIPNENKGYDDCIWVDK